MLRITNNAVQFFEQENGETVIYGTGNSGYWTGIYMQRCGMEFSCYLDRDITHTDTVFVGKPVRSPEELNNWKGQKIRVIVTPKSYREITFELMKYAQQYDIDMLCMISEYQRLHVIQNDPVKYDINKFLGYFRRKLLNGRAPTFISNDCIAGHLYEMFDMLMLSPTINLGMEPADFIKLCRSPQEYLTADITETFWTRSILGGRDVYFGRRDFPAGYLKDICIYAMHHKDTEELKRAWELGKNIMSAERLVFIMTDRCGTIPLDVQKEFDALPYEHLTIFSRTKSFYIDEAANNHLFLGEYSVFPEDNVMENYFDFLDWLNQGEKNNGESKQ